MKHNAFSTRGTILYRVWGDDHLPPSLTLDEGTPVFVCWSPTLKQWIMSITHIDYRYDAIVGTSNFLLDSTLLEVAEEVDAPSYYLHKIMFQNV